MRVKVKSLAAEAGIIRAEERRALSGRKPDWDLYVSLRDHRRREVRKEQRSAMLAYAFIRGREYGRCEKPGAGNGPDLKRVGQLIEKYGCPVGGYPKYKLPDGVLEAWVAGSLAVHPFARPKPEAVA